MANEDYWPDIEADAYRFYGWWVDMEALKFPDEVPAVRLVQMLERLPFYGGALTMAAKQEIAEQQGATAGGTAAAPAPQPIPGLPEPVGKGPVRHVDSNPAVLALDPAMAGLFEFSAV